MGKTFQYLLVSLLLGLVFLILVKWLPWPVNVGWEEVDKQPIEFVCGNAINSDAPLLEEKLFKSLCASCHKLNTKLIGPALAGVEQRWIDAGTYQGVSGREWLKRYIRDWQDPTDAGYPYAIEMNKYDSTPMMKFPQLSDEDIESILKYIAPHY